MKGPFIYENWQSLLNNKPLQATYEYPLFTDVHITGEITEGFGPYQFLNTVPLRVSGTLAPAIILRAALYREYSVDDAKFNRTDVSRYHGGSEEDEIAALLSLCMGIRIKAGGFTREFRPDKDPMGKPLALEIHKNPIAYEKPISPYYTDILPRATGSHNINSKIGILACFPELSPLAAIALTRAARQYQDAIWIAESEPELAWLLFVSAVETAAGHWRNKKETPIERMKTSRPELEEILERNGGISLVNEVAELMAPYMGATKTFIDFLLTFKPENPPEQRPPKRSQYNWNDSNLKKSMKTIYDWRSQALHGGIPFPWPMCQPPQFDNWAEIPGLGHGMGAKGGLWKGKDAPMLLHLFEYIVRHSLLNWWQSMCSVDQENP